LKVILDEGVPENLEAYLARHETATVKRQGWRGTKNGKLLDLIECAGFEAFITTDKRMEYEQNFSRRSFAVLLLSTNHWPTLEPNAARVKTALMEAQPGIITKVECGTFMAKRFRNSSPLD
jgi:hypothetical protein